MSRVFVVLPVVPALPVHDACIDIKCTVEGKVPVSKLCGLGYG